MTKRLVEKLTRDKTIVEWIHGIMASRKYPDKIKKEFLQNPELSSKAYHEFCQWFAFTGDFVEEQSNEVGMFAFISRINNENVATGTGKSKKAAKNEAARLALNLFFKQTSNFSISCVPGQINYDGSGQSVVMKNPTLKLDETIDTYTFKTHKVTREDLNQNGVDKFIKFCNQSNEGYQILVNKIAAGEDQDEARGVTNLYVVQFFFNNICIGSGKDSSIQNAYSLAGYAANLNISQSLSEIHESTFNVSTSSNLHLNAPSNNADAGSSQKAANQDHLKGDQASVEPDSDVGQIKSVLMNFLRQLRTYIKQECDEHVRISKSLAAFFIKCRSGLKLISFASGTGCCDSQFLSSNGKVINNCHALVLARRAFKRYLLFEISKYSELNKAKSLDILTFDGEKFKLKDDVEFILMLTKSPCGDTTATDSASKGCLHHLKLTNSTQPDVSQSMTNSYQGNPMKENDADIWDDMVEKIYEPTETTGPGHPSSTTINQTLESCQQGEMKRMSCTDKLTSWNVLGFQGSLINVLLEAIYVPLIVLANEDDQSEYLQWTTHSKFASEFSSAAFDLPADFVAYEPEFTSTSNPFYVAEESSNEEAYGDEDPPEHYAINWYYPALKPEIIDCMTGNLYHHKNRQNNNGSTLMDSASNSIHRINNMQYLEPSRLCRAAIFFYFQRCIEKKCVMVKGYDMKMNYTQSKLYNKDYTDAKSVFYNILAQARYGKWIKHTGFGEFHIEHN